MDLITIEILLLLFFIYSFLGWLIESVGDYIKNKKFINRGFLIGPYCPIYGTGVVLITLLLSKYVDDFLVLFSLSTILCGILEYFTSYVMENFFKARWWDYSKMKFNINGRICLETLILFGFAGVLILHFSNPFLTNVLLKLPEPAIHTISGLLFLVFIIDVIFSFNIINSVKAIKISVSTQIKDNTDEISTKVKEIIMQKSAPYRRIISAFPQAFAYKIKEGKEKIEKTAEKVKDNIQNVKTNTLDSIQNVKQKVSDNIQIVKDKTKELQKDNKFKKNYKTNRKLSLMNIYKRKK